ncbi:MAG TPA: alpha/beta hydrolase [Clostridia bacterium]|nr:alpha/beta hydrolase [Clostridia bacterium]
MDLKHKTFENRNCDIHYWHRAGSAHDYVIFLHGAGCDHRMFMEQIAVFDKHYDLLLWDARGHGQSKLSANQKFNFGDMIGDLFKLYEIHRIPKAVLIGQSIGGNLAQEIMYYNPNMISKMVLIDCTRNTGKLSFLERFILKLAKPIFYLYPWNTLIKHSANASANKEQVRKYIRECFSAMKKSDVVDIVTSVLDCLHEDESYRFPEPVLLLCGVDDRLGNIQRIVATWEKDDPNCILKMIDRAGHNSNQDNPEEVNRAISHFLELE